MKVLFFILVSVILVSCGATTKPPNKVNYKLPDSTQVEAEYITDQAWGIVAKSIAWRIIKDSTITFDGSTHHILDTSYYIPSPRKLVDSLNRLIKTKDGKQDSVVVIYIPHPRKLIKQDFGEFKKYIGN